MHAPSSLLSLIISSKLIQPAVVSLPTCYLPGTIIVFLEGTGRFVSRKFGNSIPNPFTVKTPGHSRSKCFEDCQVQCNTQVIGEGDRRIGGTVATVRLQAVPRGN